jgi:hypothetical protein
MRKGIDIDDSGGAKDFNRFTNTHSDQYTRVEFIVIKDLVFRQDFVILKLQTYLNWIPDTTLDVPYS